MRTSSGQWVYRYVWRTEEAAAEGTERVGRTGSVCVGWEEAGELGGEDEGVDGKDGNAVAWRLWRGRGWGKRMMSTAARARRCWVAGARARASGWAGRGGR